jgi:hypothetical protein
MLKLLLEQVRQTRIFQYGLAKQAAINYNNGENTVTYFGALLFNDIDVLTDTERD